MMAEKLHISVLCGGQSTEHEISIQSAKNIVNTLDAAKYLISVIFIDHVGRWYLIDQPEMFLAYSPDHLVKEGSARPITIAFGDAAKPWQSLNGDGRRYSADCVFPMVHGTQGEDGALQGLLELLNLPYVGANVQSSAVCMEKDLTKTVLRAGGIPVVDWHTLSPRDATEGVYQRLLDRWGTSELFVKAVSLGSSVATLPVKTETEFTKAVKEVFRYDDHLMVEPRIRGREIECAVLGNGAPKASLPGEIIPHHDYYSYDAKYLDPNGATTTTSVDLSGSVTKQIQQIAIDAFKMVHCSGMARVDFFVTPNNKVLVNEINTIPGFTNISMYPKMWEASGLPCPNLLDQLIELAIDRHQEQQKLIRCYEVKARSL
ncbi:D-alanine--D-alanine ligase family protein [Coxiella burnetii]|uniref:D-alanine--D-alanine ligase family protein n=1 Tax=Coxiella burnetii TaxID=777 RepID=UPI000183D10D|nr:D-alanine--D-alanine ligase family protein [Coxiella burnetii]ACJ18073.1 D-alanine--D-alanine ligase [Coxiella burnetii CbuG_Q212]OYK86523.1 D-alanine--D-alanine ligase A [Coxiella burnetii]